LWLFRETGILGFFFFLVLLILESFKHVLFFYDDLEKWEVFGFYRVFFFPCIVASWVGIR
jgi:hypothetical protein